MMNRTIRVTAAAVAAASLAMLAAACGRPSSAGPPPTSSAGGAPNAGGAASSQLVTYAQCMRAHGVPDFPDPTSAGLPKVSAQELKVSSSQLQAAQGACQHLLPTTGTFQQQARQCLMAGDCPPALVQQMLTAGRKFAQCMRSHGVPNWPDPSIGSEGRPIFNLVPVGITHSQTHSAPLSATMGVCQRLDPAPLALAEN